MERSRKEEVGKVIPDGRRIPDGIDTNNTNLKVFEVGIVSCICSKNVYYIYFYLSQGQE